MKKILVTGSESYIGSILVPYLEELGYEVIGLDTGLITNCLLYPTSNPPIIYKDTREITIEDLIGFDAVVYLAGISNDPFRSFDPKKIYDPVRKHTIKTAKLCKKLGIKFIFSSSCSIYGRGTDGLMTEDSEVFPQTPYSENKLQIEDDLKKMSDKTFRPIALRFATAFGLSPRMRLDLVLNMFTAMAFTSHTITLNSNGQAWRPLVHVKDISKAIKYAIEYKTSGSEPLILNVGDSKNNYKIIDLARIVAKEVPGTKVEFLNSSEGTNELIKDRKIQDGVDSRNYKISFEKINKVFKGFKCDYTVKKGVKEIVQKFKELNFSKDDAKNINFYRLQKLESLISSGNLNGELIWVKKPQRQTPSINIFTKRLHLRMFKESDITHAYLKALNDCAIIGLTESRYRKWTEKEAREYVKEKGDVPNESLLIGIFLKGKAQKHIGNIRVHSFSLYNKRAEVGILIWDKRMWGKNYATEAMKALCNYLFYNLNLNKICAEYYSVNPGSEKMFRKLGFENEGVFKKHFLVDNQFIDAVRVAKFKS